MSTTDSDFTTLGLTALGAEALSEGFVTAWGRIHVDLCRLTGSICLG